MTGGLQTNLSEETPQGLTRLLSEGDSGDAAFQVEEQVATKLNSTVSVAEIVLPSRVFVRFLKVQMD